VGGLDSTRGLGAAGRPTTIGGVLNSFPYTCFAENVGLVRLTQIKSRWVVAMAGLIMILIGLIPKAGAVVAGIPAPVLGGAALAMFATVAVVGIQTLGKVDFNDHRNVVVVATSLGLAMLVTAQPGIAEAVPSWAQIILGSGITLGSLTAILLNLVFFHIGRGHGAAVAGVPGEKQIRLEDVNAMSLEDFVDTFGKLFQGPTWVVENAYTQRPFGSTSELRLAFQEALFAATPEQQRELMDAYPALGSDTVAEGTEGEQSTLDQATAGLTRLTEDDHAAFRDVTAAYQEKFGFPLIVCVRDNPSRDRILEQGRARLQNSPTQEHAAALIEIAKIAGYRFDDLVADANPIHSARTQRYGTTSV
jgi:OHCU decarboxylase